MSRVLRITVPRSLKHDPTSSELMLSYATSLLPKSSTRRQFGFQDHIALELVGDPAGVFCQLWTADPEVARATMVNARALHPHIQLDPFQEDSYSPQSWATAELHLLRGRDMGLRTFRATEPDPLAGILASLSGMRSSEHALVQILVRSLHGDGASQPVFETVLRLMAGGWSKKGAHYRLSRMLAAFTAVAGDNALRPTNVRTDSSSMLRNLKERRWPLFRLHPLLLTGAELSAIFHIPSPSKVSSRHLQVSTATRLAPPPLPHTSGIRVGTVPSGHQGSSVYLEPTALLRHMAILGSTGTGKSTFEANLARDLMMCGHGMSIIEPHGTLVELLLSSVPPERLDDVILVRLSDREYPVGLNPLQSRPGFDFLVVDELIELNRRVHPRDYWGPLLDAVFRNALHATLETQGTLIEVARCLDDDGYRAHILPFVTNPEVRHFMEDLSAQSASVRRQRTAPTLYRLQRFLGTPFIRNVVAQRQATIDIRNAMDEGKIILWDLSRIGVQNAQLLGSMATLQYLQAALSRADTPEASRRPHFLLMDESSWFVSRSIGEMADQVRKFGLGLILATQRLGHLKPRETRDAIFAEIGHLVTFQMGESNEAQYLARHMNTPEITADDVRGLGQYEIYAQLTPEGTKLPAFWARTHPPPEPTLDRNQVQELVERCRQRYARPREVVETEIASRSWRSNHADLEKRARRP